MARTKLTKRARDAKQQEAVRRQQSQTAPGREMRTEKSTQRHGNLSGRGAKSNSSFYNLFKNKASKKGREVVREMFARQRAVFALHKKQCIINSVL